MGKRIKRWSAAKDPSHRARVRELVRPHRGRVAVLAVTAFVGGAVEALFLVAVTRTALAIADGRNQMGLLHGWFVSVPAAVAAAAGLLVVRLLLALEGASIAATLSQSVLTSMRNRLSDAFLRASWATQQAEPSGQLQVLANFASFAVAVVNSFTATLTAMLNLSSLIVVALVVDPLSTLVVVGALAVLGNVLAPVRRRIRARSRKANALLIDYNTSLAELSALGLEMQTFGVRDKFAQRIDQLSDREAVARRRATFMQGALNPIYTTLAYGALVVGLGVAAAVGVGNLSSVGAVMLVMLRSLAYGQQMQSASGSLMASLPSIEQLDVTLARYESAAATDGSTALVEVGVVEAQHVAFDYHADRAVLRDISFRIEPGEIVGIIGPSGAGKSTLVQLLLGLREPTSGSISVGGVDLREVNRRSWARRVAFVAQDAQLFTGTVTDNVRFFRDHVSDDDIERAVREANLLAEIEEMPDGFATFLGERGTRLSGGQRQRLSIARALAGRPHLLILDEPTSALDTHSEALIRDTVSSLRGWVTVVIIAHRMSTLEVCDRIMVIEGGRQMAFDEPAALRRRSDFYRTALELSGMT